MAMTDLRICVDVDCDGLPAHKKFVRRLDHFSKRDLDRFLNFLTLYSNNGN